MSKYSQARNLVHARHTANLANAVTRQLVESKAEALLQGKGSKDILTLLGRFLIITPDTWADYFHHSESECVWESQYSSHGGRDICSDAVCLAYLSHYRSFLDSNSTILLAGHETSATSLCWVLLEVAKNPDVQKRLRDEIRATEQAIHARGDSDFTAADLDSMEYLQAVIKVTRMPFFTLYYRRWSPAYL